MHTNKDAVMQNDIAKKQIMLLKWGTVPDLIDFAEKHADDAALNLPIIRDVIAACATGAQAIDFALRVNETDWSITKDVVLKRGTGKDAKRLLECMPDMKVQNKPVPDAASTLNSMDAYHLATIFYTGRDVSNDTVKDLLFKLYPSELPAIQSLQDIIIRSGDVEKAYLFAKYIPYADIAALQNVVIQNSNPAYACLFADEVTESDTKALQEVVLAHGNGDDARYFAQHVTDADVPALQDVVIERGSGWDAYQFAKNIPDADIHALQNVIMKRGDIRDVLQFARDIDDADVIALHQKMRDLCSAGGYLCVLEEFETNPKILAKAESAGGLPKPRKNRPS